MWIGIIILGYALGVFLLIRFLQAVHGWDEEIAEMNTNPSAGQAEPASSPGVCQPRRGLPLKGKGVNHVEDMPDWAALIVGSGVGLLLSVLLILSIKGTANAKRAKETKRKTIDEDQIPFELPSVGYDSSDYHISTKLEAAVEMDGVAVRKVETQSERQNKADRMGRRGIHKKSKRFR